jgi:hypothetical protein
MSDLGDLAQGLADAARAILNEADSTGGNRRTVTRYSVDRLRAALAAYDHDEDAPEDDAPTCAACRGHGYRVGGLDGIDPDDRILACEACGKFTAADNPDEVDDEDARRAYRVERCAGDRYALDCDWTLRERGVSCDDAREGVPS